MECKVMILDKNDSLRWINHAIAYYESLGKKQKELALVLGIEQSRISEIKNAKAKMSPNLMDKIVDLCGAPRREPGRFEIAELYDNLESFLDHFIPVTRNQWYRDILHELSNDHIVEKMLKGCGLNDGNRNELVSKINTLVRGDYFSITSPLAKAPIELESHGLSILDEETYQRLMQLHLLVKDLPDFKFGCGKTVCLNPLIPREPVVLTGKRIAAFMADMTNHPYPINKAVEQELKNIPNKSYYIAKHIPQPEVWAEIRVEVYLSEMMNYHILIHMSRTHFERLNIDETESVIEGYEWCNYDAVIDESDRIAIIKNINNLELFNQIEALRKWQGLAQDNLTELKRNIAKSGGHIPGALVLS